ncbi:MAG: hypothetical protein Q8S33_02125 [Myxococcales bacterium]|nr:hypothetical protein [Myxococcales bacterium]
MDDSTFDGLVAALSVAPENPALLKVVLEAVHHDRRWASGMTVLDRSPRQLLAERPELGLLAAGVALEVAFGWWWAWTTARIDSFAPWQPHC